VAPRIGSLVFMPLTNQYLGLKYSLTTIPLESCFHKISGFFFGQPRAAARTNPFETMQSLLLSVTRP
jgi:hypothetical protein